MAPQRRTQDQLVLDPNIFLKDFPVDPWSSTQWTNNFIQQGINRCLGYSSDDSKWVRLNVDEDGKLEVSGITTLEAAQIKWYNGSSWVNFAGLAGAAPYVAVHSRDAADYNVFDAVVVPALGTIAHTGIDSSGYASMTFYVSSTGASTVYLQFSDDNVNWYDMKSVADDTRSWSCSSEKIAVHGDIATHYVRIVVYNTAGANNTIDGRIHLRA